WGDFVQPLEEANEWLHRAWGVVGHLNAVMNSPELREAYNSSLPKVTQYYTDLGQHPGLHARFKALRDGPEFAGLARAQKKIVENELRDFRLGGAELPPEKQARFKEISERLSQLSSRFSDNLLDATNAFSHHVTDPAVTAGIPEDVLAAARESAQAGGKPGWTFTLHAPSYLPVMQHAENRALRELMYRAYVTRSSEFGKPEWDNTALIAEIVKLRREQARLLDFASYAEYSLEPKMAESPRQVLDFLYELAARAKPYAERDLREVAEFARAELRLDRLEAWDLAFASEKLREKRYAFSDQEVKQYFPETKVLPGMFKLVETLYGLTIEPATAPVWHPDVRYYAIRDRSGNPVGSFYTDLYARPSKRGGAWMDDAITRKLKNGRVQAPVAYLNCNFSAPVGGKPALFTHEEVSTLFHEFGHGLHHLLTRVDYLGVSGINGVEWDAVELPSQFMENFCWEYAVLEPMTGRADTGQPLPRALFDKMLAARNFQSGMQTVRQLEFALFDLRLHSDFDPAGGKTALELLNEVRARVAVVFPPAYNRFPQNFSHIFAGGYAAGYYSYKWAEVLSADAYSVFEENGVLDPATGQRFWSEILGVGGSRPALESFVAFRGREPKIDALLRHNGMSQAV
ncbi:MAG: M3 family metallopeptidase, partial [Candidatus Acidiferrales bacterium]